MVLAVRQLIPACLAALINVVLPILVEFCGSRRGREGGTSSAGQLCCNAGVRMTCDFLTWSVQASQLLGNNVDSAPLMQFNRFSFQVTPQPPKNPRIHPNPLKFLSPPSTPLSTSNRYLIFLNKNFYLLISPNLFPLLWPCFLLWIGFSSFLSLKQVVKTGCGFMIIMNFLNLPNRQQQNQFTIIFIEEDVTDFNKVIVKAPADKKIKHLTEFLKTCRINPFPSFFLTNKIKEKPQFTPEKELRELKEECKKDSEGNAVLLCYLEKAPIDISSLPTQTTIKSEVVEEKKKDDDGCVAM